MFISIPTILRTLQHLHYSRKGVSVRVLERDSLLRSAFMNRIADEVSNPDMLMFVDEAARNKRTLGRPKGWSLVGKRCVQRRCFGCGERFLILPILTLDGIITYNIIPGSVTSEWFLRFLCELVVCVYYLFGLSSLTRYYCRSPLPILTRVLEAFSFWTTATSIISRRCTHLLKMMLVSTG